MRQKFNEELRNMSYEVIKTGSLCEKALRTAVTDMKNGDSDSFTHVDPLREDISKNEKVIEALCLKLLLEQQPVAKDLRHISSALKLIYDLDRIGILSSDIAEIIPFLNGKNGSECPYIQEAGETAIAMVSKAVDAYVKHDPEKAKEVIAMDDEEDALFRSAQKSLIAMIQDKNNDGAYALSLFMIAKYFEKIGDHAVNLAEWIVFSETGVHAGEH